MYVAHTESTVPFYIILKLVSQLCLFLKDRINLITFYVVQRKSVLGGFSIGVVIKPGMERNGMEWNKLGDAD